MSHAPLVIVNPAAGAGKALRAARWVRDRLAARPDASVAVAARAGDIERLAADASRRGHGRVIVIGGDGSVQEAINGLLGAGAGLELGIVPAGTGNDLARSLGVARDLERSWRIAIGHATRAVDVAAAMNGSGDQRWFASAGGIGFDAQVAHRMAGRDWWQHGRAGYVMSTLAELRRLRHRDVRVSLDGGSKRDGRVMFIAIANGAYYGGGMRIAPDARVDDGLIDLCIVGDVSRLTALAQIPNLYRGTHTRHPAVSMARGRVLEIDGDPETRVHLDGEPFGMLPLRVTIGSTTVAVAAPSSATAGSPPPRHGRAG